MTVAREQGSARTAQPVLKWAGGKTQLLPELTKLVPARYNKYIEPFFGGGALFFALAPHTAVISDINPEIMNVYKALSTSVDDVIEALSVHKNDKDYYYRIREQRWEELEPAVAAARTIFLNKTCFNGLYRVNKSGAFNVPFGRYKNPKILDEARLREAAEVLARAEIRTGDYKQLLPEIARPGDFVFLDPPYVPVGKYADFNRYSKEKFSEDDQRALASEVDRLVDLGAYVLLTNSNHPLVHDLYSNYEISMVNTKRYINSNAGKRAGQDLIVKAFPKRKFTTEIRVDSIDKQTAKFPSTRFMGAKTKLLPNIWGVADQFEFGNVIDLFSGSGVVSYMFKAKGKRVLSNDYMAFAANISRATVANSTKTLPISTAQRIAESDFDNDQFVQRTFKDLYFSQEDNEFLDSMRFGLRTISDPQQRSLGMAALVRACLKKRPRGIFTYTGMRYDDGRRDLQLSLKDHFLDSVDAFNQAVFSNGLLHRSRWGDALTVKPQPDALVYIDPPYYSKHSDNEYVRRYHFVEGLVRDWQGVELQSHTLTKKFKSYPTPFANRVETYKAFERIFRTHRKSILLVSYSSNSLPTMEEMLELMGKYKRNVEVVPIDYTYSFGNRKTAELSNNRATEYLFVGF